MISDDKYQMEFANEYNVITQIGLTSERNIIKLDAILLASEYVAFRLPLYEMTLRDYILEHRQPKQLT